MHALMSSHVVCACMQNKQELVPPQLPSQPKPKPPSPKPPSRMARIVADAPVSLRVRATLDGNAKDFNGASVSSIDEVEILLDESVQGTLFHYIKAGRKKGFIKADYVEEMCAV